MTGEKGILRIGIGDALPEITINRSTKRVSDTKIYTENALRIPVKIDERLFYTEVSDHAKSLVKKAGGINEILDNFHKQNDVSLQDYISGQTKASEKLANTLAETVVTVHMHMQEDADEEDDDVDELNPEKMTF